VRIESLDIETLITKPSHLTTKGIEDGLNGEEKGCEIVERIYAYLHNLL
jgi:hypothetical protein